MKLFGFLSITDSLVAFLSARHPPKQAVLYIRSCQSLEDLSATSERTCPQNSDNNPNIEYLNEGKNHFQLLDQILEPSPFHAGSIR